MTSLDAAGLARGLTSRTRPVHREVTWWARPGRIPSVVTGRGGARACQPSRIKTSRRPAFSLRLGSVSLAPRARGVRAAASLWWPRAGSRKPGRARRPGWRGAGRAARRASEEPPARALHSLAAGAGSARAGSCRVSGSRLR